MDVGAPDGYGRFAVIDEQTDGLLCHECRRRFTHLGLHVYKAHGISANEYRTAHGLGRRGLVGSPTRDTIANNARATLAGKTRFLARRNPAAATAAALALRAQVSPAGLEAIRAQGRSRRGRQRIGTVVTCEWCGAQFCPLHSARRRRFCTRSCAARATRSPHDHNTTQLRTT